MIYRHAQTGVDIDVIKYVTKVTSKMKAKCSYCDQIEFNEPARFKIFINVFAFLYVKVISKQSVKITKEPQFPSFSEKC